MSLTDELCKLEELRQRGALSDLEYQRAKALLLESPPPAPPALEALNKLRRSRTDRWFGGVCGGLERATGVESWIWRLFFAVLTFFGGAGLVVYLLLWIFVPREEHATLTL